MNRLLLKEAIDLTHELNAAVAARDSATAQRAMRERQTTFEQLARSLEDGDIWMATRGYKIVGGLVHAAETGRALAEPGPDRLIEMERIVGVLLTHPDLLKGAFDVAA